MNETEKQKTFKIHVNRMDEAKSRLTTLNTRGAKLGCEPVVMTVVEYVDEPIFATDKHGRKLTPERIIGANRYAICTVEGAAPKFAGWTLGAVVEHAEAGNILRKSPSCKIELDPRFRTCASHCEHCNTVRNRKDTFVVIHEAGQQKLVGRDCIRDFLGHDSPENILQRMTWVISIGAELDELVSEGGGGYGPPMVSVATFLAFAACAIRHFGFISGSRARAMEEAGGHLESTSTTAHFWMNPPRGLSEKDRAALQTPEDCDVARSVAARRYVVETLGARTDLSDFENNLLIACKSDFVEARNSGLLAFVVEYHARETEKSLAAARQQSDAATRVYFPAEPKTRVKGIAVRYVRSIGYQSQFGDGFFHLFDTVVGNHRLKWSTGTELDENVPGKEYTATFTVKSHDEYKGMKQTSVSRLKFESV